MSKKSQIEVEKKQNTTDQDITKDILITFLQSQNHEINLEHKVTSNFKSNQLLPSPKPPFLSQLS